MADTYSELVIIVKDLLGADEAKIVREASFSENLEADSLDLVELIMAFEDKFGAEISDEDAQKIKTVGEAVNYIIFAYIKTFIVNLQNLDIQAAKKVTPESSLAEDLEIDSDGVTKIIEAIKSKFEVEISKEDMQNLAKLKDVVAYIDEHPSVTS